MSERRTDLRGGRARRGAACATGATTVMVLVCAMLLVWDARAEAYLDPGSGSMIIQLVLGGVAGLVVILKLYWRRLLGRFGIRDKDESEGRGDA